MELNTDLVDKQRKELMQRETETSQLSKIQLDRSFELGTKDGIKVLVSKTSSNLLIKNDCANVNIPFYDENWN